MPQIILLLFLGFDLWTAINLFYGKSYLPVVTWLSYIAPLSFFPDRVTGTLILCIKKCVRLHERAWCRVAAVTLEHLRGQAIAGTQRLHYHPPVVSLTCIVLAPSRGNTIGQLASWPMMCITLGWLFFLRENATIWLHNQSLRLILRDPTETSNVRRMQDNHSGKTTLLWILLWAMRYAIKLPHGCRSKDAFNCLQSRPFENQ